MLTDRTLFLDRDGVINVQLVGDYVKNVSELEFREDFLKSIPLIVKNFRKVFIVTNQQCIAKGLCSKDDVDEVHRHLLEVLESHGLHITNIYVCPHLAGSGCPCRKPATGLAMQAKADYPDIDFARSVMVGDSASDMRFGRSCGMETVFIGKITDENRTDILADSDHIVNSVYQYLSQLS
jgi:D-glycero-D-manno-heptose 1,7-bisphosphate phosphatase/D-glycero-alpha-D-manno-heptose 1-phosphate guanylyltransferase